MPKKASVPAKRPITPKAAAVLEQARQTEVKERLEAVAPEVFQIYQDCEALEQNVIRGTVLAAHKFGQLLNRVYKRYQAHGLDELLWALNKTEAQVNEARRLADTYSEQDLQDFLSLRTPTNEMLTKSHLLELTAVDDRSKRTALAKRAAHENMSVRELTEVVQDHVGRRPGGGRRYAQPTNLKSLLTRWTGKTEKLLVFHEQVVDKSFEDLVNNTPPDKLSADIVAQIDRAHSVAGKVIEQAEADLERLMSLKSRVSDILASRPEDANGGPAASSANTAPSTIPMKGPVQALRPKAGHPRNDRGQVKKPPGQKPKRAAAQKTKVKAKVKTRTK